MITLFGDGIMVISRNFFSKKELSSKLPFNNGDTYMSDDIFLSLEVNVLKSCSIKMQLLRIFKKSVSIE